ncbi:MAG: DUF1788 domain-containing protein [Cyanobacteria bacterium J06627_28]
MANSTNNLTILQRLNQLLPAFREARFLENRGIGNEVGFYIFDYDPADEPVVERFLPTLHQKLQGPTVGLKAVEVNLYRALLAVLEQRGFLKKAFEMEASKGNRAFAKAIAPVVRPDKIVDYIQVQLSGDEDLVLLTGVGASWPVLRSHTILNNLHAVLDRTPVVMFFPGTYDGQELRLFNTLKDDNYYRAFPLIPRKAF